MNEASNEIPRQSLDCSKAKRSLDWKPQFGMEEGLRETISWYREYYSNPNCL
jgi:CDP-glucose 4,6-dehydratase